MNVFAAVQKIACLLFTSLTSLFTGLFASLLCTSICLAATAASGQTSPTIALVSICGDPEPPPWLYWKRVVNGQPSKELTGASLDLIQAAFDKLGVKSQFVGDYPWKRCLSLVQAHKIDFALGAYFDEDRAKIYAYSMHYFSLTPQIYTRRADNLIIKHISELKKWRGCGMLGASYG
jgi:polar amino acid transport system substrate-binding protein